MKTFSSMRRDFLRTAGIGVALGYCSMSLVRCDGTFKEFEPDFHVPCTFGIKFGTETNVVFPKWACHLLSIT